MANVTTVGAVVRTMGFPVPAQPGVPKVSLLNPPCFCSSCPICYYLLMFALLQEKSPRIRGGVHFACPTALTKVDFLLVKYLLFWSVPKYGNFFSSDRSSYSDSVLLLVRQLFQILSISANIYNFSLSSLYVHDVLLCSMMFYNVLWCSMS